MFDTCCLSGIYSYSVFLGHTAHIISGDAWNSANGTNELYLVKENRSQTKSTVLAAL